MNVSHPQGGFDPHQTADLVQSIKDAADKLATENASRGDMKILNRTVRELSYAFKVFRPFRSRRKVTIFGSARTPPADPAYVQTECFAKLIAEHRWLVVTGAASGIMEAGHRGAGRENSMGLNIMLPFEQESNPFIAGDPKLVHMKYFFTRKLMFVKECDAVCLLPGGFGTLDEGLEVLTLLQTGKRDMVPVVLLDEPGGGYWPAFVEFIQRHLLDRRMICPEDMRLLYRTDSAQAAVEHILTFYRNYHSMRYVRNKLVLRVNQALSSQRLAELNAEFPDILAEGEITQSVALPEEHDDPAILQLPRLVFRFNRRDFGRLRHLIDAINAPNQSGG